MRDKQEIKKKDEVNGNIQLIEATLEAFGIRSRVVEVLDRNDNWLYSLEIVMGTRLDDVIALDKDIALALAAPGGKVEIQAPEPGRALVGIVVSKRKENMEDVPPQKYKIIRVKEKHIPLNNLERGRNIFAMILYVLGSLITQLADKVKSEYRTEEKKVIKN